MIERRKKGDGEAPLSRYQGYDRIMGSLSWLLIALVSLDIKLLPSDDPAVIYLSVFCILLLLYNVAARFWLRHRHSQFKTFIDLMVFLCFTVGASWFTGKATSPFISLLYLILMATSLTQGRRITYLMAGLAISSYLFLGSAEVAEFLHGRLGILTYLLDLFPFMLIAHLGAMLAGEAESGRREIERLSLTDDVTGIHNMRNFFRLAHIQQELASRHGHSFSVWMIDADNLKEVNDTHGHLAGTELIRLISSLVTRNLRGTDIVARYGGDEFVVLLPETSWRNAAIPAERIRAKIQNTPLSIRGTTIFTTLSIGVAGYPDHGGDVETVMALADAAMYVSKREGKNRVTLHRPEEAEEAAPGAGASV